MLDIICQNELPKNSPEDLEDLVNFRIARKEWSPLEGHLRKNASNRPHINASRIMARSQKHLWRTIPQSDDLYKKSATEYRRVKKTNFVCIRAHWNSKRTGEAEVSQFEIIPFIDEKILRLEVTM